MEAAMQREIERAPESRISSSSAAESGYQGIPDKNPGQWNWVWNEYYNNRTYMQAGVMKNSVTGEIKKTAFRDIRNDKGQIQKNLLHAEGNAFRAKLNEENGFNIIIKSVGDNTKLQKEDVILKIGNSEILDRGDLVDSSFYSRPGTFVEFLIERNGKNLTIPVRVSPRPISIQDEKSDLSDSVVTTSDDLKLIKPTDENRSDFNESGIFNP